MTQDDRERMRQDVDEARARPGDPAGSSGRGPEAERLPTERAEQPTAGGLGAGARGLDTRGGADPGTIAEEAARVAAGGAGNENRDQSRPWEDTANG